MRDRMALSASPLWPMLQERCQEKGTPLWRSSGQASFETYHRKVLYCYEVAWDGQ